MSILYYLTEIYDAIFKKKEKKERNRKKINIYNIVD